MNLKTKSEMLFPGCEKSGPCGLVTPSSTEYVGLKGLECLTSARKGRAGEGAAALSSSGRFGSKPSLRVSCPGRSPSWSPGP